MGGFNDDVTKAEQFAKNNPDDLDKGVQEGEKLIDQQTGDRFDKEVGEAGQQAENQFGGGTNAQNGQTNQTNQNAQNGQDPAQSGS